MKKLLSVTMSVVIMLSCMLFAVPAQAATQIKENQTVEVVFQRNTSLKQTFTYTMPEGGFFYYKIVPKYKIVYDIDGIPHYDTEMYLPETKLTYNYKEYGKSSVFYGSNWCSPSYCFKKGAVVTISLEDYTDSSTESYYDLTVYFKKTKNFESENNNSKKTADKLTLNKTYTGLSMDGDTDYWAFTAPKAGKYKISATEVNEGFHNTVYAYKGSKKVGSAWINSGDGYKTVYKGKLKKGQKIYFKITDGADNEMYKIKVKKV